VKRGSASPGAALVLLDEAFHLLRRSPGVVLLHTAGTMPFGLGLLFFWSDMSRSAFAADRCAAEALLLALLYLWMKTWHCRFMTALRAQIEGQPDPAWSLGRMARAAATQAVVQATAFPVLALASLVVLPLAWCATFYQNALLYGNGQPRRLREVIRLSWAQAVARPLEGYAVMAVLSLFSVFVFLEVLLGLLSLPELLRLFTGAETVFSRGGAFLLNSTLLAVAGVLCYAVVDPLLKAVCVVRCFRAEAVDTGADLLLVLRRTRERRLAGARGLLCGALLTLGLAAAPPRVEAAPANPGDPVVLRQHLEQTLQQPRYSWRLPRSRPPEAETDEAGAIARFFRQINRWVRQAVEACRDAVRELRRWLERLLRTRQGPETAHGSPGNAWETVVPYLVVLVTSALVAGLALYAWRAWRRRRAALAATVGAVAVATPDLGDEGTTAAQRPHADWLDAARDFCARGEVRLGLRAAYLASLALLAERKLLSIARFKSNRDYRGELARRAAQHPEVVGCFETIVRAFDRAWYGDHPPTAVLVAGLLADLDRLRSSLEP
jgi:hypothetical protein